MKFILIILLLLVQNLFSENIDFSDYLEDSTHHNIKALEVDEKIVLFTPKRVVLYNLNNKTYKVVLETDTYFNTFDIYNNKILYGEFNGYTIVPYEIDLETDETEEIVFDYDNKLLRSIRFFGEDNILMQYGNLEENKEQLLVYEKYTHKEYFFIENLTTTNYLNFYSKSNELLLSHKKNGNLKVYSYNLKTNEEMVKGIRYYQHFFISNNEILAYHPARKNYKLLIKNEVVKEFKLNKIKILNLNRDISKSIIIYSFDDESIYRYSSLEEMILELSIE